MILPGHDMEAIGQNSEKETVHKVATRNRVKQNSTERFTPH